MYITGIGGAMIIVIISLLTTGLVLIKMYWGRIRRWLTMRGNRTGVASGTQQDE